MCASDVFGEMDGNRNHRVGLVEIDEGQLALLRDEPRDLGARYGPVGDERLTETLARDPLLALVALERENILELLRGHESRHG